jgi:iron complex outermembrane receptor protein
LEFTAAPVGAVLDLVLDGTSLAAVVASTDHVVLATTRATGAGDASSGLAEPVVLEGIHVDAAATRPNPAAGVVVTSIDGRLLEQQGASNLADALNGAVPGVWVWARNAGSALTQYGSSRGASSLGPSAPKLFIDGLEVANPLLVSSIDPATVERVDVVRGPQAAALFGAEAIGGVTHIITRQGAIDARGSHVTVRSGLGLTGSAFAPASAVGQDHGLSVFTGGPARSARLDLSFNSLGAYVPEAGTRRVSASGTARTVHEGFALTATARFLTEQATLSESPLLHTPSALFVAAESRDIAVGQYTAGLTAAFRPNDVWTHTVVAGINGYSLGGAPTLAEAGTAADSALAAAGSSAFRTTLRVTSAARLSFGESAGGFTVSLDHSALHQDGGISVAPYYPYWEQPTYGGRGNQLVRSTLVSSHEDDDDEAPEFARERSNSGLSTRLDAALLDRLHLSAGLRMESTTLENRASAAALLPSLGGSWSAFARGDLALVLRAAYGKGVRWPQVPAIGGLARQLQFAPEVQSGVEAGVDVNLGNRLSLQATRFDQEASGLTQQVAVNCDSAARYLAGTVLVAQNVGTIANRGWELSAVTHQGALTLSGTLSLVDSRVRSLAHGYTGDLASGDRILAVPARTASISALWTPPRWSASLSLSRASDWLNYDRLAIARAQADSLPLTTAQLRDYWLHYDGSTRLRASFGRDLGERFSLRLTGENLLDLQTGEPDNATIVPGRSLSLSVRARL